MLTLKIEICQVQIEKEEKDIWKKLLNYLISWVEELEDVCLSN